VRIPTTTKTIAVWTLATTCDPTMFTKVIADDHEHGEDLRPRGALVREHRAGVAPERDRDHRRHDDVSRCRRAMP
jgi:hypothetical protein